MIKCFFHAFLSLSLIMIQTSIIPSLPIFSGFFDIILIVVLFLSLMCSNSILIIGIILVGFFMDSLSDAPLGLYTVTYIWIFILIQFLKRFIHRGNIIFLPCISAFSVTMENSFLFFSFFVRYGRDAISIEDIVFAGKQSVWAFFVIPISIVLIHGVHSFCDKLDSKGIL
ncbi:MAG: hypothetical protein HQK72_12605 [Desulfamplus sp.]|nr:hypothetical protein [Desulfamplus sp.]